MPHSRPAGRPADLADARREFRRLIRADFSRSRYPPQRLTLIIWRAGQVLRYARGPMAFIARRVVLLADLVWTQGLMGAELPHEVDAGPGLRLEHGGRGIMLHPSVRLGSEVTLYHDVTIGVRDGRPGPALGDRVFVGAGARILGPIQVADGTRVGANAVVVHDTEPDATYVGVPAVRVVRRHQEARSDRVEGTA